MANRDREQPHFDCAIAAHYAARLRGRASSQGASDALDGDPRAATSREAEPAFAWARSGAMALTGPAGGSPRLAPGHLAACCEGAALVLRNETPEIWPTDFDAPALLGERAALAGLERRGSIAPGGSCRFVRCADAWIALNLARPDDRALLPAWLAESNTRYVPGRGVWNEVARAARPCGSESLVARARLLGLAVALAQSDTADGNAARRVSGAGRAARQDTVWCRTTRCSAPRRPLPTERPLVLDLSSLWAGPLCTHLLSLAGARVIKVESRSRPDGARFGPPAFFDLLNGGKQSVALDFASRADLQSLRTLLAAADIVVESARPRALRQLGLEAEASLRQTPGQVWLSITGHGRSHPQSQWVAFGDDAAVAAGLILRGSSPAAAPLFCGDAIADPLTGLHAAAAALLSWRAGGGVLQDVALRAVVAHAMAFGPPTGPASVRLAQKERSEAASEIRWEVSVNGHSQLVLPPRAREAPMRARPLGADTADVLREFAPTC
jgi:hypothetical protein